MELGPAFCVGLRALYGTYFRVIGGKAMARMCFVRELTNLKFCFSSDCI